MDLRCWKSVLIKWVEGCRFIEKNFLTLEQTDLEAFFSVYTRHANVETQTSPMRSKRLMKFLKENYPGFNTRFDTLGLVVNSDYVYVYTLLLHYACVHNPNAYFHKICKSLPTDLQQNLAVFFKQTMENPCLTRNRLNETIINVAKQMSYNQMHSDSAPNDCLSILGDIDELATNVVCDDSINECSSDVVSSTNGVLSSITPRKASLYSTNGNNGAHEEPLTPKTELLDKHTRELLGLRAELETERFSNTLLEDELQEKKLTIHSLTQENKSIKEQLAKVKAKVNSEDEDKHQRTTPPNKFDHLKKRFSKEIEFKEKQINDTIEKVNDLQGEKLELEEKLKSSESNVHVCMEQIRELESKVTILTESIKQKTADFDCVVREKKELQQCLDETRESIKNKREVLNASSDFLDTSLSSGSMNCTPETLASSVVDKQLWEKETENNQMREELQNLQQIKHFLVKQLYKVIEDCARLYKLDLDEDLATLNALLCKYDEGELKNVIERCSQAIVEKSQKEDEELQKLLAYSNGLEQLNSNLTKINAELNEKVRALQASLNATTESVEALQIDRSDMVRDSFIQEQHITNLKESNHFLQNKLEKLRKELENSKVDFSKQQNVQNNVIKSLEDKIKEKENDLSNCKLELSNFKLDHLTVYNDLKQSYEKLSKRFELSCKDAEQQSILEQKYKNKISDLSAQIEKIEMSKQFVLSKISAKEVKISDLSIEVKELRLQNDRLNKLVTEKSNKLSSYVQEQSNLHQKLYRLLDADSWDQALKYIDALLIGKRQMSQAIDSLQASNDDLKKMLDLSNQRKAELQACFNKLNGKLEEQKCEYEEKVAKLKDAQQLYETCINKFYESVSTIVPSDKTPPVGSLNATFSDLGDIGNRLAANHSILLDLLREKDKVCQEAKDDCDRELTHIRKDVVAKKQELLEKEAELKKNESKLKDALQLLETLNEQQQKEHSSTLELIEKIDVNMKEIEAQNVSATKIIVNQTNSNSIGYMEQLSLKLETLLQSFKTMHQKYDMAVQKSEKLESYKVESELKLEDFEKNMAKSAKHTKYLHETLQNLENVNEKIYAENSKMQTMVSDLEASLSAVIIEKQRLAKELEARNTTIKVLQQDIAVLEADVACYIDQEERNSVNLEGICALLNTKAKECAEMSNANGTKESVSHMPGVLDLDLEKSVHQKQDSDKADYKQITEGLLNNLKADAEKLLLELSSHKQAKIAAENEATELQNKLIQMQQSQSIQDELMVNRDKLLRELELLRAESRAAQNEQENTEILYKQQIQKLNVQVKDKEEEYSKLIEKHEKTMLCINELKAELNSLQLQLQKGCEEKNNLIEESKIRINDLETQIKQNEKTLEEYLKELQSQEVVKDSMQKEINILKAERMELTTKQKESQNRISTLEKKRGNLEKNNRELNKQLQRDENIKTLLSHENGDLNFQIKNLKDCLDQNQIARADLEIQLKQSNERVAELGKVCAANEQLKERLETEKEELLKKVNAEVDTLRAELMKRDAEQKQYHNERYEVEQQREHFAEQVLEMSEKLIKMQTEVIEQRKTYKELHDKHQNVVKQLASVNEIEEKLKQEYAKSQKLKLDCQILQAKYKETKEELARSEQQVKEQRLELEGKLEKMKAKMKSLYNEETTRMKNKQERELASVKADMDALIKQNAKYEEHTRKLSNQIMRLNENILEHKKQHAMLSTKLKHMQSSTESSVESHQQPFKRPTAMLGGSAPAATAAVNLGTNLAMEDEEGEVFNNTYLTDLKMGRVPDMTTEELQYRNSLQPPHLRSAYAAQYDVGAQEEDLKDGPNSLDDSMSALLSTTSGSSATTSRKKSIGTHYKRPGPPTPSKNGGRLSFGGSSEPPREILRETCDSAGNVCTAKTPARFKLFTSRFSMGGGGGSIGHCLQSSLSSRDEKRQRCNLLVSVQRRKIKGLTAAAFCTSTPRKSSGQYRTPNLKSPEKQDQELHNGSTPHLPLSGLADIMHRPRRSIASPSRRWRGARMSLCVQGNIFAKTKRPSKLVTQAVSKQLQKKQRSKMRLQRLACFDLGRDLSDHDDDDCDSDNSYSGDAHADADELQKRVMADDDDVYEVTDVSANETTEPLKLGSSNNNYSLLNRNDNVGLGATVVLSSTDNVESILEPSAAVSATTFNVLPSTTFNMSNNASLRRFEHDYVDSWLSENNAGPQHFEQLLRDTESTAPFKLQPLHFDEELLLPAVQPVTTQVTANLSTSRQQTSQCLSNTTASSTCTVYSQTNIISHRLPRIDVTTMQQCFHNRSNAQGHDRVKYTNLWGLWARMALRARVQLGLLLLLLCLVFGQLGGMLPLGLTIVIGVVILIIIRLY